MSEEPFKSWAIVEVMGHQSYAGFVTAENIAGAPMLRIDVPPAGKAEGFTKYIAPSALYAISPCSEETARMKAEANPKTPFECWDIGQAVETKMREAGRLIENRSTHDEYDDHNEYEDEA